MSWYYAKNNQKNGPISDSEFEDLIQQGVITPDTLVWRGGMADWQTLSVVQAAEKEEATSSLADDDEPLTARPTQEDDADEVVVERTGPAWEQRATLGFFKALWETIKAVVQKPGDTFSTMKREGGFGAPWLFYLIMGCGGWIVGLIYQFAFGPTLDRLTRDLVANSGGHATNGQMTQIDLYEKLFHAAGLAGGIVILLIGIPIVVTLALFIYASIFHVSLKLVGGARRSFETTLRVFAYASALSIFTLIPFCGGIIAGIWAFVVLIIGLAKAHQTSTGKAVGAVLLPLVAICCVAFVFTLNSPAFQQVLKQAEQQAQQSENASH